MIRLLPHLFCTLLSNHTSNQSFTQLNSDANAHSFLPPDLSTSVESSNMNINPVTLLTRYMPKMQSLLIAFFTTVSHPARLKQACDCNQAACMLPPPATSAIILCHRPLSNIKSATIEMPNPAPNPAHPSTSPPTFFSVPWSTLHTVPSREGALEAVTRETGMPL
jgi:hypothetical protein